MAYYRRGYYRRGRSGYGYRGYNRYWRRRGWSRRGVNRAQATGSRRFKLVVPVNQLYSLQASAGNNYSAVYGISPFCSNTEHGFSYRCVGNLYKNNSFIAYSKLYDEVKVDWVSVNFECMENIGVNLSSIALYTCVDRRASYAEVDDNSGSVWPSAYNVEASASSTTTFMNSTSKRSVHRFFAATDLIEKNQFIDTDFTLTNGVYVNKAYLAAGSNPNFFCPSVLFCVLLPAAAPEGGYSIPFCISVKWGVTFRGPKYSTQAAAASKTVELEVAEDVISSPVKVSAAGKSASLVTSSSDAEDALGRLAYNIADVYDGYSDGTYSIEEDVKLAVGKLGVEGFRKMFDDMYDKYIKVEVKDG